MTQLLDKDYRRIIEFIVDIFPQAQGVEGKDLDHRYLRESYMSVSDEKKDFYLGIDFYIL